MAVANKDDASAEKAKPKISILAILKLVATILFVLLFILNTVSNLLLMYMIFAPDDFPKPFYLYSYDRPGMEGTVIVQSPTTGETGGTTSEGGTTSGTKKTPVSSEGGTTTGEGTSENTSGGAENASGYLPGQGVILDTGNKIVNLAEPGGRKYIRTNVVLEFAPSDSTYPTMEGEAKTVYLEEFKAELNNILPVINDSIISLLSSKDFASVSTPEGKEVLRQQIMEAVNSRVHEYQVIYVYFTEFVYQ